MHIINTLYSVTGPWGTPMTASADTVARLHRAYALVDCHPTELKLRDGQGHLMVVRPVNPKVHLAFS